MDFHAVAEAHVDGHWRVVDATLLAPRQTLVRISTGRDAADTAFLDNHKGSITLNSAWVTAIVDGDLPDDSIESWCRSADRGLPKGRLVVLLRGPPELDDPGRADQHGQQAAQHGGQQDLHAER